jgi:hypothetical protein
MPHCDHCKIKKVGLVPFSCRCGYQNLCVKCRDPFEHKCEYDYKKEGREQLQKMLPVIVADKLNRI